MGSPARHQLEPAFVLHQRPYRDTSLIVDLFTENYGRISVVARGVRKAKSRLSPLLQPFQPLLISWVSRGELGTLTAAENNGVPFILNPRVLISGFYINELLVRLLHHDDPHTDLFQDYFNVLKKLSTLSTSQLLVDEQIALRGFEIQLLNELGYALILDHEVKSGMPLVPDTLYHYFLEQGPLFIDEYQVKHVMDYHESLKGNDFVKIHGKSLLDLAQGTFRDASSLRESKRLMRAALAVYLGSKPLHSRSLLNGLRDSKFKS
ncbi:MAG: DNA repair protein RecO [Thiotrichaceae bacterium]|nr:DNA repair protein RecO [Thiotrichaceae bacterium]PCI14339.1 MAG: DNA repair protein RecO [Thiotrichales bacterium]